VIAELVWVGPAVIRPNPWNPNQMDPDMLEHARASIREFGFVDPVTVRDLGEGDFEIIDGEHRWRIAVEMDLDPIPVFNLGPVTDAIAQQLTIVLNETRGQADPEKLGKLLKDLMATETKEHLLSTLPYTREALDRLTGLPSLTWEALDRPARPMLPAERPAAWIERTYRMPKEAAEVLDRALAKVREQETPDVSDWQALELIAADFLGS
jgi:ParB-like chromosome segregation protein Spo0J